MRKTRILQVTHDLHPGGLPRVVDTLCRCLDRERFEVSVLCLRDTGALADALRADLGVPIFRLHADPSVVDRLAFWKVRQFLHSHPVEVLHTHNSEPFFDGTVGAALAGVRTVVHTEHGREWADTPLRWRVIENVLARYAYRVVAVSDDTARALRKWERIPASKIVTIPNGIDGSAYDVPVDRGAKREELGIPRDALVVGYASRLEPEKNLELLVRALPSVIQAEPRTCLLIAGDGGERGRLEAMASQLELGDRVRFLGVRLDVPQLLKVFDVHVLPSRREGMPMILLEAMAAGCPTLASSVGGVPSVIEHGVTGELFEPGSETALSDALVRLLRSPQARQAYATNAHEAFHSRYEARVMAGRYERLYERLPPEAS